MEAEPEAEISGAPAPAKPPSDLKFLLLALGCNLLLKLALVPLNWAEYTDGILQLQARLTGYGNNATAPGHLGLYPPLFGTLAWLVSLTGLDLTLAGRVVSAVAGSIALIPVFLLTRLFFGREAARIATILFTLSPLVLRWSIRVMTDSLFLAWCSGCLYLAAKSWDKMRERQAPAADTALALATVCAGLAAYTRYQGALLGAALLPPFLYLIIRGRGFPLRTALAALLWAPAVFYYFSYGRVHGEQLASRTTGNLGSTLLAYWNTAESFVLISPYYFGYPVAALALGGMFLGARSQRPLRGLLVTSVPFIVLMLLVHSAFGSFQYRYMMPALPLVLAFAGHGAHQLYLATRRRNLYPVYSTVMILSFCYLGALSIAVLLLQRQAFGDQKQAAFYVAEKRSPSDRIYSNERYGNFLDLGSVKASYWTDRQVQIVSDFQTGNPIRALEPGSWVMLGNHYGGDAAMNQLQTVLSARYQLEGPQTFYSEIVPLMDDIMVEPLFNQNPLGWVMRYQPQNFTTRVYRVVGQK